MPGFRLQTTAQHVGIEIPGGERTSGRTVPDSSEESLAAASGVRQAATIAQNLGGTELKPTPHLQALAGALVHAHGHVDDVAPVVAGDQLRSADRTPLDELGQLPVGVTAVTIGQCIQGPRNMSAKCTRKLNVYPAMSMAMSSQGALWRTIRHMQ